MQHECGLCLFPICEACRLLQHLYPAMRKLSIGLLILDPHQTFAFTGRLTMYVRVLNVFLVVQASMSILKLVI